jgi:hypothetical protein
MKAIPSWKTSSCRGTETFPKTVQDLHVQ